MILTLAIVAVVAVMFPRCKRARHGDRIHIVTIIVRERYNAALAREAARLSKGNA